MDDRWGSYQPWFLRYEELTLGGNVYTFLDRVAHRLHQLFIYNELGIHNLDHFGALLQTDSLHRFEHGTGASLAQELAAYFDSDTVRQAVEDGLLKDPQVNAAQDRLNGLIISQARGFFEGGNSAQVSDSMVETARAAWEEAKRTRRPRYYHTTVLARITVLESVLRLAHQDKLTNTDSITALVRDLRRFLADANVPLDIRGTPPQLCPIDEEMFHQEVVSKLLPRLDARFPDQAKELVDAYHDLMSGASFDSIFAEAFKSLEEIARAVSGVTSFTFTEKHLSRAFPGLHPTVRETMLQLAAHRGDRAAHARKPPNALEMRYLLFSICNMALLLIDYCENTDNARALGRNGNG